MTAHTLAIDRLTPSTGAIVEGVDLHDLTSATVGAIEAALLEHLVLLFPGQALEPEAQLAFAHHLGEIDVAPFGPKHPTSRT